MDRNYPAGLLLGLAAALLLAVPGRAEEAPRPEPPLLVQVTRAADPADPLLARVTVHTRGGASLEEFCRAVSARTKLRVLPSDSLASDKLLLIAHDQPLGRVLGRAAEMLNASLRKVGREGDAARYRIEQTPAQARAEAEIVNRPWAEMVRRLEKLQLAASLGEAALQDDPQLAHLARRYPNWPRVLGALPPGDVARLAEGRTVSLDPTRLSPQAVDDLRPELEAVAGRAQAIGAAKTAGAPRIGRVLLRPTAGSGQTPDLWLEVTSPGYGRLRRGLLGARPLSHLTRADSRVRELAGIAAEPETLPASPEIDLRDLQDDYSPYRLLEEIAVRGKLNLAARYFRYPRPRSPIPRPACVRRGPALELFTELVRARPVLWGIEDDWLLVAPTTWPFDRQAEIPDAALDRWLDAAERQEVGVEHVAEMALLRDLQLQRLSGFLPGPAEQATRYREGLRLWAALSPLQRQAARDNPAGLPSPALAPALRERLAELVGSEDALRLHASVDAALMRIWISREEGGSRDIVRVPRLSPRNYFPRAFGPTGTARGGTDGGPR